MNLFKAELRRILRRRISLIFGIVAVVGLIGLTAIVWANSSTGPSETDLAEAQAMADDYNSEYDDCLADEAYLDDPEHSWIEQDEFYSDMSREEQCEMVTGGGVSAEEFLYVYTFELESEGVLMLTGVAIVAGLLMMLIASSAIGAEWSSGGMSNLLVWHPNRMRVWGAKLAAACAVCAAFVIAMLVLAFGLLYLTAAVRGDTGDMNGAWWEDTLEQLTRTVVLTLGMTVLGSALAMLGRHTAIAGGVIAGYLIVGDLLAQFVSFAMNLQFPERLSLYTWVTAWISGRVELFAWTDAETPETFVITATDAGLLLGGIVLAFTALATLTFAKRDVA